MKNTERYKNLYFDSFFTTKTPSMDKPSSSHSLLMSKKDTQKPIRPCTLNRVAVFVDFSHLRNMIQLQENARVDLDTSHGTIPRTIDIETRAGKNTATENLQIAVITSPFDIRRLPFECHLFTIQSTMDRKSNQECQSGHFLHHTFYQTTTTIDFSEIDTLLADILIRSSENLPTEYILVAETENNLNLKAVETYLPRFHATLHSAGQYSALHNNIVLQDVSSLLCILSSGMTAQDFRISKDIKSNNLPDRLYESYAYTFRIATLLSESFEAQNSSTAPLIPVYQCYKQRNLPTSGSQPPLCSSPTLPAASGFLSEDHPSSRDLGIFLDMEYCNEYILELAILLGSLGETSSDIHPEMSQEWIVQRLEDSSDYKSLMSNLSEFWKDRIFKPLYCKHTKSLSELMVMNPRKAWVECQKRTLPLGAIDQSLTEILETRLSKCQRVFLVGYRLETDLQFLRQKLPMSFRKLQAAGGADAISRIDLSCIRLFLQFGVKGFPWHTLHPCRPHHRAICDVQTCFTNFQDVYSILKTATSYLRILTNQKRETPLEEKQRILSSEETRTRISLSTTTLDVDAPPFIPRHSSSNNK